jgi:hypothetical protein
VSLPRRSALIRSSPLRVSPIGVKEPGMIGVMEPLTNNVCGEIKAA